ncbi:MAG: thioredoxin family protein [Candidatus Hodarchaeales archaeon]
MVATESEPIPLGTIAPDFTLKDAVSGEDINLMDFVANKKVFAIMFICNHCPFVKHVMRQFKPLAEDYLPKGVGILAINSNSIQTHPQDGPKEMKKLAESLNWSFPFLFDETQEVAKAYRAACTPDFYIFDGNKKLVYHGQLDSSRPSNDIPVTGKDMRAVLGAVLEGKEVSTDQKPSIGCNIKWHPGNEPDYFG